MDSGICIPSFGTIRTGSDLEVPVNMHPAIFQKKADSRLAITVSQEEVLGQLSGRIALILDGGKTPGGVPSTVVDCLGAELKVLREGPITKDEILAFYLKIN